tara:strand:+ start:11 stop:985 length:975 start_codon:yes stop_codon:yes gene_type:complete
MSSSITSRRFPSSGAAPPPNPFGQFQEARRVQGNQNTQQAKKTRSAAFAQDRETDRVRMARRAQRFAVETMGARQGRIYTEQVNRALSRNENIPLPQNPAGRAAMMAEFPAGATGAQLRGAGFDVPRQTPTPEFQFAAPFNAPIAVAGGGPSIAPTGASGVSLPSSRFPVSRVSAGNDVEDTGPRFRPQPQPEPEPEPERVAASAMLSLAEEGPRRTGGGSGGLVRAAPVRFAVGGSRNFRTPTTLTTDQQFDELVSQRSGGVDPFAPVQNTGLASQRSAPIGVGSQLTPAQRQRDAELIAQLEAEPRSSPRGRGNPLKRAGTI